MREREKPELSEEIVGVNPFVQALKIKVRTVESGYVEAQDHKGVMVPKEVELECDVSYKSYVSKELREIRVGLSYRALQMWEWIMQSIESGADVIWIDPKRYKRECAIKSEKTFRQAQNELGRYGFITPCMGVRNSFFINPKYGFKGSRIRKYPGNLEFLSKE